MFSIYSIFILPIASIFGLSQTLFFRDSVPGQFLETTEQLRIPGIDMKSCEEYCVRYINGMSYDYNNKRKLCAINFVKDHLGRIVNASVWQHVTKEILKPLKSDQCMEEKNVTGQPTAGTNSSDTSRNCTNIPEALKEEYNCNEEQVDEKECKECDENNETCLLKINETCYGTKDDQYGKFIINKSGSIKSFILNHTSGWVSCTDLQTSRSHWGCGYFPDHIITFITDNKDTVIYPDPPKEENTPKGYQHNSNKLHLELPSPYNITEGQELRVWYSQDLNGYAETNNHGKHCVEVYAQYLCYNFS